MKRYLTILFFGLFGLFSTVPVFADAAPPAPPYLNTKLNIKVGLGSYVNNYVIIERFTKSSDEYKLAENSFVSPEGYGATTYLAIDKEYFKDKGGISGIFSTVFDQEFPKMSPKDNINFNAHVYNFVLSKDDGLLNYRFGDREYRDGQVEIIDGKYIKFPFRSDFYIRKGDDDENCFTGVNPFNDCQVSEDTWFYLPEKIVGNNIVLAKSDNIEISGANLVDNQNNNQNVKIIPSVKPQNISLPSSVSGKENLLQLFKLQPLTKDYMYIFTLSLIVTLIIECVVVLLLIRKIFKIKEQQLSNKKILIITIFASLITLPYVWFVFPYLFVNFVLAVVVSELFALIVETIFYKVFLDLSFKYAFIISFVANLMSFIVGLFLKLLL